jgi:hypothetical protein
MLSRRFFLAATLTLLLEPQSAFAKKRAPQVKGLGPHTLAREEWPPAITPDFIEIIDKGYALLCAQSGRLAIVDFKKEEGPQVIGELNGLGKKVIDLALSQHRVFALTAQDSDTEQIYSLAIINLSQPNEPAVSARIPLSYLSEPTAIAASGDFVAVGGTDKNGQNQIVVLNLNSRRTQEEAREPIATLNVDQPVAALDFQERQLTVLEPTAGGTTIDIFNMFNPRAPQKAATVKLEGTYSTMARIKEMLALAGQSADRSTDVRLLSMHPAPHVVSGQKLPLSDIQDITAQRGQLLVLGNRAERMVVLPLTIGSKGKDLALSAGQAVVLPAGSQMVSAKARMAATDKEAYIAAESGSVQLLSIRNNGWEYTYSHTIPRLPVASVAFAGNTAVLGGSDIKVYDVSTPEHPALAGTADLPGVVHSVASAGNLLLVFARDALTLRRLDKPSDVVATLKISGQKLAYDARHHKAYVLSAGEKETTVTPVAVSQTLSAEPSQKLAGVYRMVSALDGNLLVSGLNELALYDMATGQQSQLGSRIFPNLAIRDIALLGDRAVLTAVDSSSRGFLLTINTTKNELPTIGSVNLPQDAVAIAASPTQAVVVGRSDTGKDLATIVDLSNSAAPKAVATFPVLEAASAVAIKGKMALVGGRGLEILNL